MNRPHFAAHPANSRSSAGGRRPLPSCCSSFSTSSYRGVASRWQRVYLWFVKSVVALAEMPIASGAAGRVDVGGEAGPTWSPDGLRRKPRAANKGCDSYLQRWVDPCMCVLTCRCTLKEEWFTVCDDGKLTVMFNLLGTGHSVFVWNWDMLLASPFCLVQMQMLL